LEKNIIGLFCNRAELHHELYTNDPQHLHLLQKHPLPSSPFAAAYHQTDWPLGSSHAASDVKLCLPLFDPSGTPICTCCRHLHPFGDHIFDFAKLGLITQFTKLCHYPSPLLSTAGYLLPTSKLDIKPLLYLPPDPHARPFIL
jgi:hypothetical protein